MNFLIGWLLLVSSVVLGLGALGDRSHSYLRFEEFGVVMGAGLGAFIAANRWANLRALLVLLADMAVRPRQQRQLYIDLMCLMFEMLQRAQSKGARSLEVHVLNPRQSSLFQKYSSVMKKKRLLELVTDNIRLLADGSVSAQQLQLALDHEIEVIESEAMAPVRALSWLGEAMPAFGIVAAIIGMIRAMLSIGGGSPSEIGLMMASAMMGTMLGVLLAYGLFMPLARRLEERVYAEMHLFYAFRDILVAYLNKFSPFDSVEYGRKLLESGQRPSMLELEQSLRSALDTRQSERY